jgi:hypothetical protein
MKIKKILFLWESFKLLEIRVIGVPNLTGQSGLKADRFKPMQGKKSSSSQNRFWTGVPWYLEFLWRLDVGVWMFPSSSPPLTCLRLSFIFLLKGH